MSRKPPAVVSVAPSLPVLHAARLLKTQCEKGRSLLSSRPITSASKQAWETVTRDILIRAFGSESPNVGAVMDVGIYAFAFGDGSEQEWEAQRAEDMETRLKIMDELIDLLHSSESLAKTGLAAGPPSDLAGDRNRVFLVHGHHEGAIQETARWLERFGLTVTILREQPNSGRTIIEKFIDFSDVAFAVILLTGDDRGGPKDSSCDQQKMRARQNVILELGFFLAKLGRKRVCAVYQDGVEIPSDYDGVLFVPFDAAGAWRLSLAKELKAAGLHIDMNRAV